MRMRRNFFLDEELWEALERRKVETGTTPSESVRRAIAQYFGMALSTGKPRKDFTIIKKKKA